MRFSLALLFALGLAAEPLQVQLLDRDILTQWMSQAEPKNDARLARLRALFTQAGCTPREDPIKHQKLPNLICELPGPDDQIILIGAHYDKVDTSSGVIDNWTGAALLPALFRALQPASGETRHHKLVFVAFAEEEKGLIGSKAYASALRKEDRPRYHAMINVDSLGLGPTAVWPSRNDQQLILYLTHVANATKLPVNLVNLEQVGLSDSLPFRDKKIPTMDFHSITQATWPVLHTHQDNASALVMDDYWNSYRLISTYLAYLDQKLATTKSALP